MLKNLLTYSISVLLLASCAVMGKQNKNKSEKVNSIKNMNYPNYFYCMEALSVYHPNAPSHFFVIGTDGEIPEPSDKEKKQFQNWINKYKINIQIMDFDDAAKSCSNLEELREKQITLDKLPDQSLIKSVVYGLCSEELKTLGNYFEDKKFYFWKDKDSVKVLKKQLDQVTYFLAHDYTGVKLRRAYKEGQEPDLDNYEIDLSTIKYFKGNCFKPNSANSTPKELYEHSVLTKISSKNESDLDELLQLENNNPGFLESLLSSRNINLEHENVVVIFDLIKKSNGYQNKLYQISTNSNIYSSNRIRAISELDKEAAISQIKKLAVLLENPKVGSEIKERILDAIVNHKLKEFIPLLQSLHENKKLMENWVFGKQAITIARGSLGDESAIKDIIRLYYKSRANEYEYSKGNYEPLNKTINAIGSYERLIEILSADKGGTINQKLIWLTNKDNNEFIRRWALEELEQRNYKNIVALSLEKLGDSSWLVAMGASDILSKESANKELEQLIESIKINPEHRLFALYTRLRINVDYKKSIHIPTFPRKLNPKISPAIRETIIRNWVPNSRRESDIRLLIEEKLLPPVEEYKPNLTRAFLQSLKEEGYNVSQCEDYAEDMGSGYSSFCFAKINSFSYSFSYIGPYMGVNNNSRNKKAAEIISKAKNFGFNIIDKEIGSIIFDGLNIYFFGYEKPLSVGDLLFYWQD